MAATSSLPGSPHLLLVTVDPACTAAAADAARLFAASLDILPTVDATLAWLLHPSPTCTHLLAPATLPASEIDALAGMLNEATNGRASLFLLGSRQTDSLTTVGIDPCDAETIARVLQLHLPPPPPETGSLSPDMLRVALHEGRLRMHFQPVLDAQSLRVIGVEALARLHHPVLGILRPAQFMPQAVASGQERTLSNVAAARAMMELRGQPFMRGRRVAFNMPLASFIHPQATDRALDICAIADLPPQRAMIELLETATQPDLPPLSAAVTRWRNAGFGVGIDDAGPRLPHWRALLDLPFTALKLDGSLAAPAGAAMAADIVSAAKRRGLFVVAEAIEDAAAMDRMRALSVDALQGFLFCRPVPARALQLWSEAWDALIGPA